MPKSIALYGATQLRSSHPAARSAVRRLAHEATTLALGCGAAAIIVIGLYLVAPPELRDAILSAFLGFDQPIATVPAHPPLSL
jgi:hypothetical protein